MQEIEVVPVRVKFIINSPFRVATIVVFVLVLFLMLLNQ